MRAVSRFISSKLDAFLGRGEHAVTVPSMDGALQPNNELETFVSELSIEAPDNLVEAEGRWYFSSGAAVYEFRKEDRSTAKLADFSSPVSALAATPGGGWAVGLTGGELRLIDKDGSSRTITTIGQYRCHCPTAVLALNDHTLIVAEGATEYRADQWKHDLMKKGSTGSVWRIDTRASTAELLAGGLAFPYGLARGPANQIIVSESWRHRLLTLQAGTSQPKVVLDNLPGYPSRIAAARDGGYWLCVFAPRSQLIEFVLREDAYRQRMLAEIDERYWVAPALASGHDFKEPLQGGAIKSMGILKPWAPTRSYGLVIKLDAALRPERSLHSRSDGRRHGITSVVDAASGLFVTSKGGNEIASFPEQRT